LALRGTACRSNAVRALLAYYAHVPTTQVVPTGVDVAGWTASKVDRAEPRAWFGMSV
jgi:hypothetical protein